MHYLTQVLVRKCTSVNAERRGASSQGRLYKWTEHTILTVTAYGDKFGPKDLNDFTSTQSIFENL